MMAPNPNPARISAAMWWLWEQLQKLEPSTRLGGIFAAKPGYHHYRSALPSWDYSVRDATDRTGPASKAAALDWTFPDAQRGDFRTIAKYTSRLLASAKDRNDPRLDGWREFYGNADSDREVEGWDTRYGVAATSDDSHLWHVHLSESRSLIDDYANKRAMLSVLKGETVDQWRRAEGGNATPSPAKPSVTAPAWPGKDLRRSTTYSTAVELWQAQLKKRGYTITVDGIFGEQTVNLVKYFQRQFKLNSPLGVLDRTTWDAAWRA